jgi:protein kinase C substrate 80K-H
MGGNVNYIYKPRANLKSIHLQLGSTPHPKEFYTIGNLQDMVKNLQGMKLVFALQMVFIGFLVILWMLRSRARSKRRRYLLKNVPPINRSAN